jgi:hypothetical protein
MNMTKNALETAVAAFVATVTGKNAATLENSKAGKSAIAALRTVAELTHDGGMDISAAKAYITANLKAVKMKDGSIKPYATAFTGYRVALSEGHPIATGYGDKGTEPLSAPNAREFNYSQAERETRKALADARKELSTRIAACKDLSLLREVTELLPEVVKADKAGTVTVIDPAQYLNGVAFAPEGDESEGAEPAEAVAA